MLREDKNDKPTPGSEPNYQDNPVYNDKRTRKNENVENVGGESPENPPQKREGNHPSECASEKRQSRHK